MSLVLVLHFAPKKPITVGVTATAVSYLYERFVDVNGWSRKDFWEREVGIVGGVIVIWRLGK
jgi:hypothetical protein